MHSSFRIGKQNVDPDEWVHFVSKPFSLFTVSVWHFCYKNFIGLITQGKISISDGIFIQNNGVVHSYRKKKDLDDLRFVLVNIYNTDRGYLLNLLAEASQLNQKAEYECLAQRLSFEESIDLACRVAILGAVLPRFLSEVLVSLKVYDDDILDRCIKLKRTSLYPRVLSELSTTLARKRMSSLGYSPGSEDFISVDEWSSGLFDEVACRHKNAFSKKDFVLISEGEITELLWSDDSEKYLEIFEERISREGVIDLRGRSSFPGLVRGNAYVCLSSNVSETNTHHEGDILVTVDSNPNLISLIKKSTALIVEEADLQGGLANDFEYEALVFSNKSFGFSHGAILSKELEIPCVTGVRNATKLIRTGDTVELDATHGIVRLLKKAR